jgi:hypothetical protein
MSKAAIGTNARWPDERGGRCDSDLLLPELCSSLNAALAKEHVRFALTLALHGKNAVPAGHLTVGYKPGRQGHLPCQSICVFVDGHKNASLFNSLYNGTAPVLYLRREALMLTGEVGTDSQPELPETPESLKLPACADFAMSDERVKEIGADIFALKILLPALLNRVGRLDPILGSAIKQGFQDAGDQIEQMIAACSGIESPDRCSNALASIRRLRAAMLTELSSAPLISAG